MFVFQTGDAPVLQLLTLQNTTGNQLSVVLQLSVVENLEIRFVCYKM